MANQFRKQSLIWEITATGTIETQAPGFNQVNIRKVVYVPSAAADDLVLQDKDSTNTVVLKAGAADASPIHVDFGEKGKWVTGLKCSTIDGGTGYIYLR